MFAIFADSGEPYLARTTNLRKRLRRLLGPNARLFSLREVARRVESQPVASSLESALTHYEWAKRYFGESWSRRVRLRWPSYVKLILTNAFPRTQVTARLTGSSLFYGPFPSRTLAETFEERMLDLYQLRRCVEDLDPSPNHPGCIYGEMNLCMRPCQEAVTLAEYDGEVSRVRAFLETGGTSLRTSITTARERASENLEFEEAQRQQKRLEKLDAALKQRSELAADCSRLDGVAVLPSIVAGCVRLWPVRAGSFQTPLDFPLEGAGVSMDSRLRLALEGLTTAPTTADLRQEHLAILSHWFHSSHRDGEWLAEPLSYRKLVRTISSVAQSKAKSSSPPGSS